MPWPLVLLLTAAASLSAGCQSSFERYYVPATTAELYPPVEPEQVQIIEAGQQRAETIRERLYPDAIIVGSARFVDTRQPTGDLRKFAASIGSDVAIWSAYYIDTLVYTDYRTVPRTQTATITTREGNKVTKTEVETETNDVVPRTVTREQYEHEVIYLRDR